MVDFPDSSMFPVRPVSRAMEDRPESELQKRKRQPLRKPEQEDDAEDSESEDQKHSLDLDA